MCWRKAKEKLFINISSVITKGTETHLILPCHYAHRSGKWDWAKWNCPNHMHCVSPEGESHRLLCGQGVCVPEQPSRGRLSQVPGPNDQDWFITMQFHSALKYHDCIKDAI